MASVPGGQMALAIPPDLLGFRVSGDVDGITIYTDRYGRKIAFKKSWPDKPPSASQAINRARFRTAVASWRNLTQPERDAYERATLSLSLYMTGINLYVHLCLRGTAIEWEQLCQSSGESLYQPPWVRYT